MADADEDVPNRQGDPNDVDLSEETQDYRFLSSLKLGENDHPSLPKRGEKDFEPNPTLHQRSALDSARQAMHDAISYPRLHHPKNHNIGYYEPDHTGDSCIVIDNARGPFYRTMGLADSKNRVWLLPEEALWLLERGSLDVRWPSTEADADLPVEGIPMSVQAAYATLIGRSGLSLERYHVYAGLKRSGYIVRRASTWYEDEVVELPRTGTIAMVANQPGQRHGLLGIFRRVLNALFASRNAYSQSSGPLVAPGFYRDYNRIYQALSIIPFHQLEDSLRSTSPTPKLPFRIAFEVYKPSTPFKKSSPPNPDFRIAVANARTTQVPTLQELSTLLDSLPGDPPLPDKKMEFKLKHGYRNVVLAVVDTGVVSYIRFSDSIFGNEKLYLQKKQGGRKGGHRKGQAKSNANPATKAG